MELAMTDRQHARRASLGGAALAVAGGALALLSGDVTAQTSACRLTALANPPRQVLRCPDGLALTAEQGAAYQVLDQDRDGRPEAARLNGGALLVETPPGRRPAFQILTPHAIASVRGTTWATEVAGARTSVFVLDGAVAVARSAAPERVLLRPGQGVDVEPATRLEVKRWSPGRAGALLARLGR
jgi:ferric-dicitrate binding protein FerR (iron transport regulator)